jgi:hypothetical protein
MAENDIRKVQENIQSISDNSNFYASYVPEPLPSPAIRKPPDKPKTTIYDWLGIIGMILFTYLIIYILAAFCKQVTPPLKNKRLFLDR